MTDSTDGEKRDCPKCGEQELVVWRSDITQTVPKRSGGDSNYKTVGTKESVFCENCGYSDEARRN
jgi:predicted nucleic-acid-binding Zn-ribbon protein